MPPEVAGVLNRSCMDCHSNRTDWPWYSNVAPASWFVVDHVNHGRRHLNFSRWGQYTRRDRLSLLNQICATTKGGSMPLGSYTLAWQIGVSLGLTAGVVQVAFALWRPPSQSVAIIR